MRVEEHTITLDQSPVFYRSAPAADPPPLFLHGIPTSSDDWGELLERTGGLAPDLIGFGRSGKGGHLDYSLAGLSDFLIEFLDELDVERVKLVAHDWGAAIGLTLAEQHPERVERIVLCNPLPPLPTVHWHRLARTLAPSGDRRADDGSDDQGPVRPGSSAAQASRPARGPGTASMRSGSSSIRAPSGRSCACTGPRARPCS